MYQWKKLQKTVLGDNSTRFVFLTEKVRVQQEIEKAIMLKEKTLMKTVQKMLNFQIKMATILLFLKQN